MIHTSEISCPYWQTSNWKGQNLEDRV